MSQNNAEDLTAAERQLAQSERFGYAARFLSVWLNETLKPGVTLPRWRQ